MLGRKPRILFVDSNQDTLRAVSTLLERRGFEIVTAQSVEVALAAGTGMEFDLLLSEVYFPDGSGYDLLKTLRAHNAALPGIAVTASVTADDLRVQKHEGFDMTLPKPFAIKDLEGKIREALSDIIY